MIDQLIGAIEDPDSLVMLLFSYYGGGVWSEKPDDFSAVFNRDAKWLLNGRCIVGPEQAAEARNQVARLKQRLKPFTDGRVPFTYLEYEGPGRPPSVFGEAKLERLCELKARFDPENRLRYNANIVPRPRTARYENE